MSTTNNARIHRFRNMVAVSIGDNDTQYLTPALARQLAEELARFARDVEEVPKFPESTLSTVDLQGES